MAVPPTAAPKRPEAEVAPTAEARYRQVHLVVGGVPASRIADVNRGILLPISGAVGDFTFRLEIDVESAEGLTEATLETKIKETIRQIGAWVVGEDVA